MSRYRLSFAYLVLGTLAILGFIAFFKGWPQPFISLFVLAIPFYLATLTLSILVHPIICTVVLLKKRKSNLNYKNVLMHLVWSIGIAAAFFTMILNGHVVTA